MSRVGICVFSVLLGCWCGVVGWSLVLGWLRIRLYLIGVVGLLLLCSGGVMIGCFVFGLIGWSVVCMMCRCGGMLLLYDCCFVVML